MLYYLYNNHISYQLFFFNIIMHLGFISALFAPTPPTSLSTGVFTAPANILLSKQIFSPYQI